MPRIPVKSVSIAHQFEDHHYTGCDGWPAADVFSPVWVETVDGREFYLPMGVKREDYFDPEYGMEPAYGYREAYDADKMRAKVERVGSIDPERWIEVGPRPSLEEELGQFGLAWQREQEDRMAWGACAA